MSVVELMTVSNFVKIQKDLSLVAALLDLLLMMVTETALVYTL